MEERLRLVLRAQGRGALVKDLDAAAGAVLGDRFQIERLLAAGRQSFVFLASDCGVPCVVKLPALDLGRPLSITRADVASGQRALEMEHRLLQACSTRHLPAPVALHFATSPLPAAARVPAARGKTLVLVEDLVAGQRLSELALGPWRDLGAPAREDVVRRVAVEFVRFWDALLDQGFFYGDVSADNILIEPRGRVRVVDGASGAPRADMIDLPGFTPAFTTPRLHDLLRAGAPVPGNAASILPALAKVLHFALTRREPLNGQMPDLAGPELASCSPQSRAALSAMLDLDRHPEDLPRAQEALERWAEAATGASSCSDDAVPGRSAARTGDH